MAKAATRFFLGDANHHINDLVANQIWDVSTLTYSFPTASSNYAGQDGGNGATILAFSTNQKIVTRHVFNTLAQIIPLTFQEITELDAGPHAIQRLACSSIQTTATTSVPGTADFDGDSWFKLSVPDLPVPGSYDYCCLIAHEIGHGILMKHPHGSGFGVMSTAIDALQNTVMSYRSYIGAGTGSVGNASNGYPQTYMGFDIECLQGCYGAATLPNKTVSWSPTTGAYLEDGVTIHTPNGNKVFMCVHQQNGNMTVDASNYSTNQTWLLGAVDATEMNWITLSSAQIADLGSGHSAPGNVAVAAGTRITSVKLGTGTNSYVGNSLDQSIVCSTGNDTINGGGGTNTVYVNGTFASYSISGISSNAATLVGSDGTKTLSNVQFIHFADGTRACNSGGLSATRYCMIGIW